MPELPDITIYVEALERRVLGEAVADIRICSPFLLRTFDPPLKSVNGKAVQKVRRLGKRIALGFDDELWLVLHLMIAGRLHWKPVGVKLLGKSSLAPLNLLMGAYSSPRQVQNIVRRSTWFAVKMHCESTTREVSSSLTATFDQFQAVLRRQNHTLKRSLTDPRLFSGIGNAYSDEILHRAVFRHSP